MADEQRDPIDRLLDDALATYSGGEPWPGLEQRILSRVRTESALSRLSFLRWALPLAAAAACLLVGMVFWPHRTTAPGRPAAVQVAVSKPPDATVPVEPVRSPRANQKRLLLARQPALPKRAVFPTPTPLTGEERALAALVRSAPREALELFKERPPEDIEPIRVGRIEIQPLQINDATQ